ncbi:M20/M25/M40 family metallo-hydrolase [Aquimarina sp. AD1]|uniref:M20/M25/M40 family metallo-hydrolase n=1 Tax=Aquimarina sp. (strain AD1) TaxID=1714848 RepID=UPI000E53D889|nr:M20/M25/M40 family metallo-hydrolase [Aquimarina sp. AD1]AXT56516.1 M20/M25/M40 family metallo-hydrolase [Aquimarina sp. AD1]RKN34254.1 M20/M25/M40 family metallo-hydrolase [Aquimarina sp. AD1]
MKQISLFIITLLFINCKEVTRAQSLASNVAASDVESIMNFLASDELGGRDTGSEGLEKAAKFIEEEFKKSGIDPYFDSYLNTFDAKGTETYNVVGYLKGTDPDLAKQFVVIGAHFDHIGTGKEVNGDVIANGANDNAAGSTAVISLAKHFAKAKSNKRSILFVLFGAEERGLLGSSHLAKALKDKNLDLYTMVNFEMIGVPLNDKSYKAYITGYEISNMADKMNEYSGKELIGFLPKAKEFQLFRRSDNYPFYEKFKVPCQTISTFDFTNYEYYHHVDDEVSEMNFEFMAELINDCIPAITKILNTSTKEIKLN